MMDLLVAFSYAVHVLVAPLWLVWLWRRPTASKTHLVAHAVAWTGWVVLMHVGGAGWQIFTPGRWIVLAVCGGLLWPVWRANKALPWRVEKRFGSVARLLVVAVIALMHVFGVRGALAGQSAPEGVTALELQWPLPQGTSWVIHGGDDLTINHHQAVRAQSQALDVVQVQGGRRASGLAPKPLGRYVIWGVALVAPCSGEVGLAVDGLEDLEPPQMDPEHLAGNHVVLHCQGHSVVLAHLKKGSVQVRQGEHVGAGDQVGRVGNSGNTSEPHLHMHAIKGVSVSEEVLFGTGEPVPMRFEGRYLTRTSVVEGVTP